MAIYGMFLKPDATKSFLLLAKWICYNFLSPRGWSQLQLLALKGTAGGSAESGLEISYLSPLTSTFLNFFK